MNDDTESQFSSSSVLGTRRSDRSTSHAITTVAMIMAKETPPGHSGAQARYSSSLTISAYMEVVGTTYGWVDLIYHGSHDNFKVE